MGWIFQGATAASYSLRVTEADSGANFSVVVSNSLGQVKSSVASLIVKDQPGISVLAGQLGGWGMLEGVGESARLGGGLGSLEKGSLAVDVAGNIYQASSTGLLKISPKGEVTRINIGVVDDSREGEPRAARIAVDPSGTLYVYRTKIYIFNSLGSPRPNRFTSRWEKIAPDGARTTLTSLCSAGVAEDMAVDAGGQVYAACGDSLEKLSASGTPTPVALSGPASLNHGAYYLLTIDRLGTIYLVGRVRRVDGGTTSAVYKVSPSREVTILAGPDGDVADTSTMLDGKGTAARLQDVTDLAVGPDGTLYVIDAGKLREISPAGEVKTWAMDTKVGGAPASGLTVDATGNVYLLAGGTIRKVSPQLRTGKLEQITSLAGKSPVAAVVDGPGQQASFMSNYFQRFARGRDGTIYFLDNTNGVIRKVSAAGEVSTLANIAGEGGAENGVGATAKFYLSSDPVVAVSGSGDVYVRNSAGETRKVTPAGVVTTILLEGRKPIVADARDNLYYVGKSRALQMMDPSGAVVTLAEESQFIGEFIDALATGLDGNVYVVSRSDATLESYGSHRIYRVSAAGLVTRVFERVIQYGRSSNGLFRSEYIMGLAVDAVGTIFFTLDSRGKDWRPGLEWCSTIEQVTGPAASIVVAGSCSGYGVKTGPLPGSLGVVGDLAVDERGTLYTFSENTLLKIQLH